MLKLPRDEYERRYKERVESCRKAFDHAKAGSADILRQLKIGGFVEPDGSQAYRNALVAERVARSAYAKALRVFTDFIIHGKISDDDKKSS